MSENDCHGLALLILELWNDGFFVFSVGCDVSEVGGCGGTCLSVLLDTDFDGLLEVLGTGSSLLAFVWSSTAALSSVGDLAGADAVSTLVVADWGIEEV